MGTPINPKFEALAEKLDAVKEAEPGAPLPSGVVKDRGGVPEVAIAKLKALATGKIQLSPFGPDVEVTNSGEE